MIAKERGRELTAHHILEVISENLEVRFKDYPLVEASIRNNLGYIYNWGLNDSKAALMHMERAARIGQEHLGEEYAFSNTLGSIYNGLGRYKEAESEFDSLMEVRRRQGVDELSLTFPKYNLACTYLGQGRYKEAESLELVQPTEDFHCVMERCNSVV